MTYKCNIILKLFITRNAVISKFRWPIPNLDLLNPGNTNITNKILVPGSKF